MPRREDHKRREVMAINSLPKELRAAYEGELRTIISTSRDALDSGLCFILADATHLAALGAAPHHVPPMAGDALEAKYGVLPRLTSTFFTYGGLHVAARMGFCGESATTVWGSPAHYEAFVASKQAFMKDSPTRPNSAHDERFLLTFEGLLRGGQ